MSLMDQVIEASGISATFARRTLQLAIERAGVDPTTLSPRTLRQALTEIEVTLSAFLQPTEVHERMNAIFELAKSSSSSFPAVRPPVTVPKR